MDSETKKSKKEQNPYKEFFARLFTLFAVIVFIVLLLLSISEEMKTQNVDISSATSTEVQES